MPPLSPPLSNPLSLPTVPVSRPVGGFWSLLGGGLRALLLRPPHPGTVSSAAGHCVLLVLAITAMGIAGEYWMVGSNAVIFNWSSLRETWFDLPILLLGGAWLVQARATALNRPMPPLHFAAVMISSSVWIVGLAYTAVFAMAYGWLPTGEDEANLDWIYFGAPVWAFIVAIMTIRRMHRFSPIPVLRRLLVLIVLALVTAWYLVVPSAPYWDLPEGEAPEQYVERTAPADPIASGRA